VLSAHVLSPPQFQRSVEASPSVGRYSSRAGRPLSRMFVDDRLDTQAPSALRREHVPDRLHVASIPERCHRVLDEIRRRHGRERCVLACAHPRRRRKMRLRGYRVPHHLERQLRERPPACLIRPRVHEGGAPPRHVRSLVRAGGPASLWRAVQPQIARQMVARLPP
jgi:hypothetical protein